MDVRGLAARAAFDHDALGACRAAHRGAGIVIRRATIRRYQAVGVRCGVIDAPRRRAPGRAACREGERRGE
jgi:hypothetical protein